MGDEFIVAQLLENFGVSGIVGFIVVFIMRWIGQKAHRELVESNMKLFQQNQVLASQNVSKGKALQEANRRLVGLGEEPVLTESASIEVEKLTALESAEEDNDE